MRTENEMNGKLSTWMKSLWPEYRHFKASDKYQVGVPDFILWGNGKSCVLESKFIPSIPTKGKSWLKHPFSAPQKNFMRSVVKTGNIAFGLVGVKETKRMMLISIESIDKSGNINSDEGGKWFPITKEGTGELMEYIFKEYHHGECS